MEANSIIIAISGVIFGILIRLIIDYINVNKITMFKIKFEKVNRVSKEDQLLKNVKEAIEAGGWEAGKEVCRNTKGKSAAILYMFIDEVIIERFKD